MNNDLILALFHWAVLLSGYSDPGSPPKVEYVPHSFMVEHACNNRPCNVIGWYSFGDVVYVDDSLHVMDVFESSVVVHEFVHYLQHIHNAGLQNPTCPQFITWEREAYSVQQRYLIQYGDYLPLSFNLMDVKCEADTPPMSNKSQ